MRFELENFTLECEVVRNRLSFQIPAECTMFPPEPDWFLKDSIYVNMKEYRRNLKFLNSLGMGFRLAWFLGRELEG